MSRPKNTPMQEALKIEISSTLNRLIELRGISQTDLSEKTGIPKTTINGYIKGTSLPTPGNVEKLAKMFNVSKADIDPRFRTDILNHSINTVEILPNNGCTFKDKLKQLRESRGLSMDELVNELYKKYSLSVNKSTISRWENGVEPKGKDVLYLAHFFNVSPNELMDLNLVNNKESNSSNLINYSDQPSSEYTYFPVHASAGLPIRIESVTDAETITIPDAVLGRHAGDDELFFMRVNGDSMNKVIPHQSLIGVKPIQINELKDEDIIVYSDGYNYSVKRFYRDGDRLIFRPESHDASFTDYTVSEPYEDLRLHGKVVIYIVNLD